MDLLIVLPSPFRHYSWPSSERRAYKIDGARTITGSTNDLSGLRRGRCNGFYSKKNILAIELIIINLQAHVLMMQKKLTAKSLRVHEMPFVG